MSFALTQLAGFGVKPQVGNILARTNGNTFTNTIAVPAATQVGDLMILCDAAVNGSGIPTAVTPSGFTNISNVGTSRMRQIVSYKVATAADLGTTLTGMDGNNTDRKTIVVFYSDVPFDFLTIAGLSEQATTGNPTLQTIEASEVASPVLLFGTARGIVAVTETGTLVTNGVSVTTAETTQGVFYEVQSNGSANRTFDMPDTGAVNCLASFYVKLS